MTEGDTVERLRRLCEELPRWLPAPWGDAAAPPPRLGGGEGEVRWPHFRDAASTHCVAPLLAEGLGGRPDRGEGAVDPVLLAWLRHQREQNRLRVERMTEELAEILHHMEGLPLIPLKGPAMAALYQPDPTLRPMNDLDLLLPEAHFPEGIAILESLGYHHTQRGWKHDLLHRPGNDIVVELGFEHRDNPRSIELHPRCRERLDEDVYDLTDRLYASARRVEVLGTTALLPAPQDLWLYLLLHATHHILMGNFRLLHLVDLAWVTAAVEDPVAVLETLDPQATHGPLALLVRTFPAAFREGLAERCLEVGRKHLPPPYAQWAEGLDLYSVSYLNPAPWRVD